MLAGLDKMHAKAYDAQLGTEIKSGHALWTADPCGKDFIPPTKVAVVCPVCVCVCVWRPIQGAVGCPSVLVNR